MAQVKTGESIAQTRPELAAIRQDLIACLRCTPPSIPCTLASINLEGGDKARSRPRGMYGIKTSEGEVLKRKPAHGQWTNVVHAVGTCPPGSSRPLTKQSSARKVQAIATLQPLQIASIRARYANGDRDRLLHANAVATFIAQRFRADKVRKRVRAMVVVILFGGGAENVRIAAGMSKQEWRDSNDRKTYYTVRQSLDALDVESLYRWSNACRP